MPRAAWVRAAARSLTRTAGAPARTDAHGLARPRGRSARGLARAALGARAAWPALNPYLRWPGL